MTVECSFGIAAAKWRILNKPIETSVDKAIIIVQAISVLHIIIIDFEGIPKDFNRFVEKQMIYERRRNVRQNVNVGTTRRNNRASNSAIEINFVHILWKIRKKKLIFNLKQKAIT